MTPAAPNLIELVSFTARAEGDTVNLAWETAIEIDNAGFYLYRRAAGEETYVRLNSTLIAAQATSGGGASYQLRDTPGSGQFDYLLEDVDTSGRTTRHGPVRVGIGQSSQNLARQNAAESICPPSQVTNLSSLTEPAGDLRGPGRCSSGADLPAGGIRGIINGMHIVINGWFAGNTTAGSGQYIDHLLHKLPRLAGDTRLSLLRPRSAVSADAGSAYPGIETRTIALPPLPRNLAKLYWEQVAVPRAAQRLAGRRALDSLLGRALLAALPHRGDSPRPDPGACCRPIGADFYNERTQRWSALPHAAQQASSR